MDFKQFVFAITFLVCVTTFLIVVAAQQHEVTMKKLQQRCYVVNANEVQCDLSEANQ